jgi:repressor LexA
MDDSPTPRRGRPPGPRTAEGELTGRQAAIVRYITETVARQGYPPSMREIGQAVRLASTSSVAHQLTALEHKGVLYRDPRTPRAYRVRTSWAPELGSRGDTAVQVPLVGTIAAGAPLLAEETFEDVFVLPRQMVGDGEVFALKLERRRVRSRQRRPWGNRRRAPGGRGHRQGAAPAGGESVAHAPQPRLRPFSGGVRL